MGRPLDAPLESFELFADGEGNPGFHRTAWLILPNYDALASAPDNGFTGPYDPRLVKSVVKAATYLVASGQAKYSYAAGDEIVALLPRLPGPPRRQLISAAVAASVELSLLLGLPVRFDARLFEFPAGENAASFVRWRQDETYSRAVVHHCRSVLHATGMDVSRVLEGLGDEDRIELLRQNGFDVEQVPPWQWRGTGVYTSAQTEGNRLIVDTHLPDGDAFARALESILGR